MCDAQRRVGLLPHRRHEKHGITGYTLSSLNEGWGFCPTDAGLDWNNFFGNPRAQRRVGLLPHRRDRPYRTSSADRGRSTKGGASAPPTRPSLGGGGSTCATLNEGWGFCPTDAGNSTAKIGNRNPLNEGWGFCPTDARRMVTLRGCPSIRSTKGGASAPPTPLSSARSCSPRAPAQRRVGLLPHRRHLGCDEDGVSGGRSTKGGASAPPTPA